MLRARRARLSCAFFWGMWGASLTSSLLNGEPINPNDTVLYILNGSASIEGVKVGSRNRIALLYILPEVWQRDYSVGSCGRQGISNDLCVTKMYTVTADRICGGEILRSSINSTISPFLLLTPRYQVCWKNPSILPSSSFTTFLAMNSCKMRPGWKLSAQMQPSSYPPKQNSSLAPNSSG